MAIANNSEVEDLSDDEKNDPTVDECIPHDFDLMSVEQQPDDSKDVYSPEDDSDEDYSPPDAAQADHYISEDSDSQNESEPQHPQVHKLGSKQQHVENDGEPERTKKWTIRMLMHFTDLALVNSWLLYCRDNQENGTPRKAIMKFLEFRVVVAQVFLNKRDILDEDAHVPDAEEDNAHLTAS